MIQRENSDAPDDIGQNRVNKDGTDSKIDKNLTQPDSRPVRYYELVGPDGKVWGTHVNILHLASLAKLYWPDQEQDEDRTGKGWDIQVVGS